MTTLINNAGNSHHNMPFDKATEEELDSIYNVHFQRRVLPDPEASSVITTGADRQHFDGPDSLHLARRLRLRLDEGSSRGAVETYGKGARTAQNRCQRCRSRRHGNGFQRRHRSRQPSREQEGGRRDSTGPGRCSRRHRSNDCLVALRGQSVDQRRNALRSRAAMFRGGYILLPMNRIPSTKTGVGPSDFEGPAPVPHESDADHRVPGDRSPRCSEPQNLDYEVPLHTRCKSLSNQHDGRRMGSRERLDLLEQM